MVIIFFEWFNFLFLHFNDRRNVIHMIFKCQYCNQPAVYHRKISNEKVCANHFCSTLENKIRKTVRKFQMFDPTQKVVVGVSGGKDSLVLLYNVLRLQKRNPDSIPVEAILIDEGIEGYRNESLLIAKKMCEIWNVKLHIIEFRKYFGKSLDETIDSLADLKVNACTVCGTVRRRLLNDTALELNADKLAIGHNLDDISETFIQNILRNDLKRIRTKPPHGNLQEKLGYLVPRIKPLMEIPEIEISRYCYYKNIPIQSTPCPYIEGFFILRKKVQDFLNDLEENSAEVKYNIIKLNENLFSILKESKPSDSETHLRVKEQNNSNLKLLCSKCGSIKSPNRDICYYCELKIKIGLK